MVSADTAPNQGFHALRSAGQTHALHKACGAPGINANTAVQGRIRRAPWWAGRVRSDVRHDRMQGGLRRAPRRAGKGRASRRSTSTLATPVRSRCSSRRASARPRRSSRSCASLSRYAAWPCRPPRAACGPAAQGGPTCSQSPPECGPATCCHMPLVSTGCTWPKYMMPVQVPPAALAQAPGLQPQSLKMDLTVRYSKSDGRGLAGGTCRAMRGGQLHAQPGLPCGTLQAGRAVAAGRGHARARARLGQGGLLQARLVVEQRELVVAAYELRAQQVALAGHQLHLAPLPQPLLHRARPPSPARLWREGFPLACILPCAAAAAPALQPSASPASGARVLWVALA